MSENGGNRQMFTESINNLMTLAQVLRAQPLDWLRGEIRRQLNEGEVVLARDEWAQSEPMLRCLDAWVEATHTFAETTEPLMAQLAELLPPEALQARQVTVDEVNRGDGGGQAQQVENSGGPVDNGRSGPGEDMRLH